MTSPIPASAGPVARGPARRRCGRLIWTAAVFLVLAALGGGLAIADPVTPPVPVPPPVVVTGPQPTPAPTVPVTPEPTPAPAPQLCPGSGCPTTPARPPDSGTPTPSGNDSDGGVQCGITHIRGCVADAIDSFFSRVVDSALNPLLSMLSQTLLTTPEPGQLPRIGELWHSSWQIVVAVYGLVVLAAGLLLMVRETLQTRWGLSDLLPRLVIGFVAAALSLPFATHAIRLANALAHAVGGDGLDPTSAGASLQGLIKTDVLTLGMFGILLRNVLMVALVVLMVSYVLRVTITVVLIVGAPLALMCHALPGMDAIARWWWRAFAAVLTIQVVQSLVLCTAVKVLLAQASWGYFGPGKSGLVNLLVAIALMGLLIKIPFWLLNALKIGQGHSMTASLVRSYIRYKTFQLIRGGHPKAGAVVRRPKPASVARPPADPYERVRATREGQLMLPLKGVHKVAPPEPTSRITPAWAVRVPEPQGEQLMLPVPAFHGGVDLGPKPRLGRDGQYQLPITATRVPKPAPATPPSGAPGPARTPTVPRRRPQGRQLALDLSPTDRDPYAGIRPGRGGQYQLPIQARRGPVPPKAPAPPVATPPSPPRSAGRQLHLPLPDLPVRRRPRRSSGGSR